MAGRREAAAQRLEDLRAPAQGFGEIRRADRRDHELLEVEAVVRMRPPIDDVHEGDRQAMRVDAADVSV